jgi:outer membrane protein OmpA-like peptidoglycan-associated protein/tetratricopeptide (TPR) repeat protein
MYRILLSLCLILMGTTLAAQDYSTEKDISGRSKKLFERAKAQFRARQEKEALMTLEKVLDKSPRFVDAWLFYADLLLQRQAFARAEEAFEAAVELAPDYAPLAYYLLGQAEMEQQKYAEAQPHLQRFLDSSKAKGQQAEEARQLLRNATFAEQAVQNPVPFNPKPLSSNINSPKPEYLPSISADGQYLVYTSRPSPKNEDIFISERGDSSWLPGQPVQALNTPFNDSSPSIAANGQAMAFARNDGRNNFDLYYAERQNGRWNAPQRLPSPINTGNFESQPSLSANGQELFFVSDRKGGKGRLDLWMSELQPDGSWGTPHNLSDSINTPLNEQAPFLHSDGQTLYFMSKGHPGMGQYDLFLARRHPDGSWGQPLNLGYPINSPQNEGAIIVSLDGQTAYFDSDKADPTGQIQEMGNADLYQFELYKEAQPQPATYVEAKVRDARSKRPLSATAEISRLSDGQVQVQTQASEKGWFLAVLPIGADYALSVAHPSYLFHSEHFALSGKNTREKPFELLIELEPLPEDTATAPSTKPVVLRNVFFDTGSANLRPESAPELNRLARLLKENPGLNVRINGHTDNVGSPEDNQALSEARAKAVYDFLLEKGIEDERLSYKGFGESRPVAGNDTAEERQRNRRTEFEVLKK